MKTQTSPKPFRKERGQLQKMVADIPPMDQRPSVRDLEVMERRRGLEKKMRLYKFNGLYYIYTVV